ncbi:MAG TPA: cyclase family protein, partial [Candidatus Binatus sp.]|nr:cyclase family protein [Candidatus Binatus sp.]
MQPVPSKIRARPAESYSFKRVVDLSHPLYPGMPGWPTQPSLLYEAVKTTSRDTYALTLITRMVTHTGTHIDAPAHFLSDGKTVDRMPFESYHGMGTVIDLSKITRTAEEITPSGLR